MLYHHHVSRMPRRSPAVHAALTLISTVLFLCMPFSFQPSPVFAATIEITPSSAGWAFLQETATGSGSFVNGPGTAPLGTGSVRLTVNNTGGYIIGTTTFTGTRLADLTRLEYSTYRASGGANFAITLQFNVDYDPGDAYSGWQGRLIYEPYYSGITIQTGVWQTWDALSGPASGTWWASGAPGNTLCPQANPCTWNEVLTNWPEARIHPTLSGMLLKAGGGWSGGFDGNVDALTIGINSNDTTFDFNPPEQCTTVCYVATTGNNLFGGTSPADAKRTIPAAVAQVDTGGTVIVAAGTYTESVVITRSLTLQGAGIGQTILDGNSTSGVHGITINGGVNNVTISDLSIKEFDMGIRRPSGLPNDTILFQDVSSNNNLSAGIAFESSNSVTNITFRRVTANFNGLTGTGLGRGIMLQSMYKENIVVEDGVFIGNRIAGIDLNDGPGGGAPAVRGIRITGNTVSGVPVANQTTDSGISILGLDTSSGNYENIVASNTITMYGRFGIEIKGSTANGQLSGPNSMVVRDNRIVQGGGPLNGAGAAETRDIAGIVVGNVNNAGIPNGIVVINNEITGIQQNNQAFDVATGFGISASGTNIRILHNIVTGSGVGIQMQAGFTGTQTTLNDPYFGRDTTITTTGGFVNYNVLAGNTIGIRNVGVPTPFDARCNAWESASGPLSVDNPGGVGQPLSGAVVFAPWLIDSSDGQTTTLGFQFPASINLTPPGDLSAADNDYRRIANAIGCVQSGQTLNFSGVFDWSGPYALASWALGNDAVNGTDDDYSSMAPAHVHNVTLTAANLGSATITGTHTPTHTFLRLGNATNQDWQIENLQIIDFALGFALETAGSTSISNTIISSGTTGIQLEGISTTITLGNTAFSGQTGDYIKLVNNPNDVDARNATFNGQTGAQFDLAQSLAVQAQITDRNDNSALGLVILMEPYLLVMATGGGLDFGSIAQHADLPAGMPITVTNPVGSAFAFAWSLSAPAWLECTPASGSLAPGESTQVTCRPKSSAASGVFSGTVSITSSTPGVGGSPQSLNSSFSVADPPADIIPQLTIQAAAQLEGDSGILLMPVTATLNIAGSTPVSFTFRTQDDTAVSSGPEADFDPVDAQVITFLPGMTTQTFFIAVRGDERVEPNETLTVSVTHLSGLELAPGGGVTTITILNDDTSRYTYYLPLVVTPATGSAAPADGAEARRGDRLPAERNRTAALPTKSTPA